MRMNVALIALLALGILALSPSPSSAATGDGLASFPAPDSPGLDSGRGLAFDGDHLYYTANDPTGPPAATTDIYKVTASGTLVETISTSPATELQSLAWDGEKLWATDESAASAKNFYTVDRASGTTTFEFSIDLTGALAACETGETLDGLTYDLSTGTLWVSAGGSRTVYNVTTTGSFIRSFDISTDDCVTGLSTNGETIWAFLVDKSDPAPINCGWATRRFQELELDGTPIGSPVTVCRYYADMDFDPVTFAPLCAAWVTSIYEASPPFEYTSRIAAFEIPCVSSGYDEDHYGNASSTATEFSDDPVNVVFGNFVHQNTDISIPALGMPLEFARTYNSANPIDGVLGFGWTHNYNMELEFESSTSLIIHHADGRQDRYLSLGGGNWQGPPDVFDTLTDSGGQYFLTTPEQIEFTFDSTGKLETIADRNDNTTTLSYFSSGPDMGRLETVTDPGARVLTFTYQSGRIATVTDSLDPADGGPRTVTLGYNVDDDLETVQDVKGGTTTYSYTNHLLETIVDSNGNLAVQNCYSATTDRVERQYGPPIPLEQAQDCNLTRAQAETAGLRLTEFFYNTPAGGQTTLTDPRDLDTVYSFDNLFRITDIQDPLLGETSFEYDSSSNRTCVADPLGNQTGFAYDAMGHVTQMIDALNTDANCDLLTPSGVDWEYTYNSRNDPKTETDPLDRETEFIYDDEGIPANNGNLSRIVRRDAPAGSIVALTCFELDSAGLTLAQVESTDLILPAGATDSCTGNRTQFGYDAAGNQTCLVGARFSSPTLDCDQISQRSTFSYDLGGRLRSVTDELGHVTTFEYDHSDNPVSVADDLGNTTTYEYDAKGNLTTLTEPNRQPVDISELGVGGCGAGTGDDADHGEDTPADEVADDGCPSAKYTYDSADRLVSVLDALGNTTTYGYDFNSNRTSITNANRQPVGVSELGVGCGLSGTGDQADHEEDPIPDGIADDGCPSTLFTFDEVDRLSTITDALGRVTTHRYDAVGNAIALIDGNHSPVGLSEEDIDGCGAGTGDGNDNDSDDTIDDGCPATTRIYDPLNRIERIQHWDGPTLADEFVFTYDAVGNRLTMQDPTGTTNYSYDALNRMTCFGPNAISGSCPSGNTGYKYDDDEVPGGAEYPGQRTKITYPDPTKDVDYAYEADGRMKTVKDWLDKTTTYNYDNAGRLQQASYPPGVGAMSYQHDSAGRQTVVAHQSSFAFESYTYTYDASGNRETLSRCSSTQACTPADNPATDTYTYDALNRLERVDYSDLTHESYLYDSLGNRTEIQTSTTTTEYHYDDASQLYHIGPLAGGSSLGYDNNGNWNARLAQTYVYDHENRLTKILHAGFDPTPKACHDLAGGGDINIIAVLKLKPVFNTNVPDPTSAWFNLSVTQPEETAQQKINILDVLGLKPQFGAKCGTYNSYNGDGLRTAHWSGKLYTSYQWDVAASLPVVLQEATLELHNDGNIPEDVSSIVRSDATYVYGLGLVSATDGAGAQQYYFTDALGSTMWRADGSGNPVGQEFTYDPFGNLRGSGDTQSEKFLFTGQQFDENAFGVGNGGLYYLRARYYDPALGRFLTKDPIQGAAISPQTQNQYAYALNNPVNRVDPWGLASESFGLNHYLSLECLNFALSAALLGLSLINPWIGLFGAPLLLSFALVLAASSHDVGAVPANAAVGAQGWSAFGFTSSALLQGLGFWAGYTGVMYNMASCIWGGSVFPPANPLNGGP